MLAQDFEEDHACITMLVKKFKILNLKNKNLKLKTFKLVIIIFRKSLQFLCIQQTLVRLEVFFNYRNTVVIELTYQLKMKEFCHFQLSATNQITLFTLVPKKKIIDGV